MQEEQELPLGQAREVHQKRGHSRRECRPGTRSRMEPRDAREQVQQLVAQQRRWREPPMPWADVKAQRMRAAEDEQAIQHAQDTTKAL